MTTYNTSRKKHFRCLFALVTVIVLAVPYVAFGAASTFGRSSSSTASGMHGQSSFSHGFHLFGFFDGGFFDGDGLDDQQVVIIQQSPAPTTEPSAPAENR